ncbi:MAG: hypothetical protein FJZ00_04215 [Candidatus Sericytochromatia bacterium]|uniref:Uncharacterized protein n=1 Tax=Candidatus Tanganyikabacteria bacterium TaxID=2961651 RepID=A0A937X4R3_9BACT|nr:hypothetical protein [Candidatus Tanganyikabacteria bacterium]
MFDFPWKIAVDAAGNLYVTERSNQTPKRVRKLTLVP